RKAIVSSGCCHLDQYGIGGCLQKRHHIGSTVFLGHLAVYRLFTETAGRRWKHPVLAFSSSVFVICSSVQAPCRSACEAFAVSHRNIESVPHPIAKSVGAIEDV